MKKIKTIVIIFLLPITIFCLSQCLHDIQETSGTVHRSIVAENNFADNSVLVVLQKEDPKSGFRTYTTEDFSELSLNKVLDITACMTELVIKQTIAERTGDWKELKEYKENAMLMNIEEFRRILYLELKEKSVENVLDAIRKLERRGDVLFAEPDNVLYLDAIPNPTPTYYTHQWGLHGNAGIRAPEAWDITTGLGNSAVKVGVIDLIN